MTNPVQSKRTWHFRHIPRLFQTAFSLLRGFFSNLRNVDVDEVGTAVFKHCTSPKALYVTLFERWWIVALFALLGCGFGAYVIKTSVEAYESHGSILIYQKLPTFVEDKVMLPDPKAYDSLFSTHVQLIASPMLVEKAIHEHHLEEHCPGVTDSLDAEENQSFEDYIRSNLKVSRAGSGDSAGAFVINVGFGHTSKREIPVVIEAVLETYQTYVNESLLFDQKQALSLVMKQRNELEAEMNSRNEEFRNFLKSAPGIWNRTTENNPHQANVEALSKELTELQLKKIGLEARVEIMRQTHDPATGAELTDLDRLALIDEEHIARLTLLANIQKEAASAKASENYPLLQETESVKTDVLLALYGERAELLQNVGPSHPMIIDLDAKIAETKRRLQDMTQPAESGEIQPQDLVAAYARSLEKELNAAKIKINFVNKQIDEEVRLAQQLTDFTEKAKHLEATYQQSLTAFQAVDDKVGNQNLLEEYGNFVAEIVSYPHHIKVTWPKKPVILALCTILGIFAGSFISLALDLIAYSPLRGVFWFVPRWLLGGNQHSAA